MADHERELLKATATNQSLLTAMEGAKEDAETAATAAAGYATIAGGHKDAAAGSAAAAEGFKDEAEGFRNEAEGFKDAAETAANNVQQLEIDLGAIQSQTNRALRGYRDVKTETNGRNLALGDHGCIVVLDAIANHTFTLQALPVPASDYKGVRIDFTALAGGVPEVSAGQDVTLIAPNGSTLLEAGLIMRIVHVGDNTWIVDGSVG